MSTRTSTLLLGMVIVVVYLVSTFSPALASVQTQSASDRAALVALYNATNGPNWTNNSNWLSSAPLSNWYGVTTDTNGRVTILKLPDKNLSGPIPPELGNLTSLRVLYLDKNQLSGPIPPELGSLTNLTSLSLTGNQLTGSIPPELGNLTNLTDLFLVSNQMNGTIPHELGNLTNLKYLFLQDNQLSGPLPQSLARLSGLRIFRFKNNPGLCAPTNTDFQVWLEGIPSRSGPNCGLSIAPTQRPTPVSQQLSPISKASTTSTDRATLVALYNATNGPNWKDNSGWLSDAPIGVWYGVDTNAHGRVTVLNLRFNLLNGVIPMELGDLTELKVLNLWANSLNGPIPPELGDLINLESLSLSVSKLRGPIPSELGNLTSLETLGLSGNQLSGSIPSELGNLTNLETLSLWSNQLDGAIPSELGNLINLESLGLSGNQLSGSIPSELGNLTNLKTLALGDNRLTGNLPMNLTNIPNLGKLGLENNPDLCAPTDAAFQSWLKAIEDKSGPDCGAVVQTYPSMGWFKGRTLHVSVAAMDRLPELRYSVAQSNGEFVHLRIAPSKDTMELLVFRVRVQNHTATSVVFTVDEESAQLGDFNSERYFPMNVGERAEEVTGPPGPKSESRKVLELKPDGTLRPKRGFIRGPIELQRGTGLDGWIVFEAPKETRFRYFRWLAGDSITIPFGSASQPMPTVTPTGRLDVTPAPTATRDPQPTVPPTRASVVQTPTASRSASQPEPTAVPKVDLPVVPSPTATPFFRRGFFVNSVSSVPSIQTPGQLDLRDPITLSIMGILITLAATAVQLFRGR